MSPRFTFFERVVFILIHTVYVKDGIDYKPREDLNMHKPKELESYFIEQINQKGKNSIIGIIYRHPCMDKNLFIEDYMKPLNDKLAAENKKTYCW